MKSLKRLALVGAFALGTPFVLLTAAHARTGDEVRIERIEAEFTNPPRGAFATRGTKIAEIDSDSPLRLVAEPGDMITRVNGELVDDTEDFVEAMARVPHNSYVTLEIVDAVNGRRYSAQVYLE